MDCIPWDIIWDLTSKANSTQTQNHRKYISPLQETCPENELKIENMMSLNKLKIKIQIQKEKNLSH